jgi:ubiquinone/menaquinone biosynthesis C-methylase UbiE/uncharacterized protein YbaR (Trm112 family)
MGIPKHILSILRSPDNHTKLRAENDALYDDERIYSYPVRNGIPILLATLKKEALNTSIHEDLGTSFNYIEHYQEDARQFDYFRERPCKASDEEAKRLHETIMDKLPSKSKLILDVGCGSAWVANNLCPKGIEVISFDISYDNPAKAIKKYPFENHHALVGDAFNLPFEDESFDGIVASEIIEHVADPRAFIKELFRVIRQGGKLVITTPYDEKIVYSLCIHCNRPTPIHAHLHSFTEKGILSLTNGLKNAKPKASGFANKVLILLRVNTLFSFLPYKVWKKMDAFLNKLVKKPSRLLLEIKKVQD